MYNQHYRMNYNQPQYTYKNRFDMGFMSGLLNSVPLPVIIGTVLAVVVIGVIVSRNKKSKTKNYTASMTGAAMRNLTFNAVGFKSKTDANKYIFATIDGSWIKMVSVIMKNGVEVTPNIREARYFATGSNTMSTLTTDNVNDFFNRGNVGNASLQGYHVFDIKEVV